jgi:hypothetical protein
MVTYAWIILVLVIAFIGTTALSGLLELKSGKILTAIPDFEPTKKWINPRNGIGLAVDVERNKLALIEKRGSCSVLEFQKILAVEVCKNGTSLIKTNRGSQVAGAAIGAVLLGPMGLLVGAVTGSKRKSEKINRLSLKIYVSDVLDPVREIYKGYPIEAESLISISPALEEWHDRLRVIVASHS